MSSFTDSAKFHLRQQLGRARRVFLPVPLPAAAGGKLRLHLGCGAIDHPGFVNIDGIDRPHVHFVQTITKLTRFANGSIDFIYTSHTLEHFPRDQTLSILAEWYRVLTPGGRLCISVPDFDRMVSMYHASGNNVDTILPPLFGGQDYPFNFHYTAFTASSLGDLLARTGFLRSYHWQPGIDGLHDLPDWSGRSIEVGGARIPISLNLEAVK